MFSVIVSGYVTDKGVELKNYKGSDCAEFWVKAKCDTGKQAILLSVKVWGTRSKSVADYVHAGDQFSFTGPLGSVRTLPPQGDNTEGLVAMNVNLSDYSFPKPAGATAGGRRPEASKPVTPKLAPRSPVVDDDEVGF
jgi:hypothetical protein